mgnify:CR=1 FL=1
MVYVGIKSKNKMELLKREVSNDCFFGVKKSAMKILTIIQNGLRLVTLAVIPMLHYCGSEYLP